MAPAATSRKRKAAALSSPGPSKAARRAAVLSESAFADEVDSDDSAPSEDDIAPAQIAVYQGDSDVGDVMSSESEPESEPEEAGLRNALESMPFGALLKAQRSLAPKPDSGSGSDEPDAGSSSHRVRAGKHGRTEPRHALGTADLPIASFSRGRPADATRPPRPRPHRDSKHAPSEMTSKRAVGRARQVVDVPKIARRDPRFDALSGAVDDDKFVNAYSFLDDQRATELKALKARLSAPSAASIPAAEREELKATVTRMEDVERRVARERREREVLTGWRKQEREQRAQGKKAHHLSRREERELLQKDRLLSMDKNAQRKSIRRKERKEAGRALKKKPRIGRAFEA